MRSGTKSSLLKVLKQETKTAPFKELPDDTDSPMRNDQQPMSIVVDAMSSIRRWSFLKGDSYGAIAEKYFRQLLSEVPKNTMSIHFCCDRYNPSNLKVAEQEQRYSKSKSTKVYEVQESYLAPEPNDFFAVSQNKANLLDFLCEEWSTNEELKASLGDVKLYLGGGFKDETKSIVITRQSIARVPELESTQSEADTRVILHSIFAYKSENVKNIVIHAVDTDVVVLCIYYAATQLQGLTGLWVRSEKDVFLPIHLMASALGVDKCRALPFIHSLSGRDTTSYPFFTGKKAWFDASNDVNLSELESFGENPVNVLSEKLKDQARALTIAVYSSKADYKDDFDLGSLRVYKFLNNRSTLLRLLPPTEDAFDQHLKRAALATLIDKNAHIAKPKLPKFSEYGWTINNGKAVPCPSTQQAWPRETQKALSCTCMKGCMKNCPCARRKRPCYKGCRCQGHEKRCKRMIAYIRDSEDSDDSD